MVKANLSNEAFEFCIFDSRIIELMSKNLNQLYSFVDSIVPSARLLEFIRTPSLINTLITSTASILIYLKKLPETDKLAFLGTPEVAKLLSHETNPSFLEHVFMRLSGPNQAYLTQTDEGLRLLSNFHSHTHLLSVFMRLPNEPNEANKINYTLRWCLHNPGRFLGSLQAILFGFSLSVPFKNFLKSSAFFECKASLDPCQKARASLEIAIFFLSDKPASSLQTLVSRRILQTGEYSRKDICEILMALPIPYRFQFFFNEQVLTQWKNSGDKKLTLKSALDLLPIIHLSDNATLHKIAPLVETLYDLEHLFNKCTSTVFCDLVLNNLHLFDMKRNEQIQIPNRIPGVRPFTGKIILTYLDNSSFISTLDQERINKLLEFSEKLKVVEGQSGYLSYTLNSLISTLSAAIKDKNVDPLVKRMKYDAS
jgi:hypothetical protein